MIFSHWHGKMEKCEKLVKSFSGGLSELVQACPDLFNWLFRHLTGFGEELVGEADEFFFEGFREEVLGWQGELLGDDFGGDKSGTSMPFADSSVWFEVKLMQVCIFAKHLGSNEAVPEVVFSAHAKDGWGMAAHDSEIMQHRAIHYGFSVDRKL